MECPASVAVAGRAVHSAAAANSVSCFPRSSSQSIMSSVGRMVDVDEESELMIDYMPVVPVRREGWREQMAAVAGPSGPSSCPVGQDTARRMCGSSSWQGDAR